MNWSLNWFKSKKQIELEELKVKEQEIKNKLLEKKLEESSLEKPYRSLKLVNNTLTVVFKDGSLLAKPSATNIDFTNVKNSKSEDEIMEIMMSREVFEENLNKKKEIEKIKALQEGLKILEQFDEFEVKDNSVYFKGINRSIPPLLVEKFAEIVSEHKNSEIQLPPIAENIEYQSLKRFFLWCCLNPRAEVVNKLYDFLVKNSFRITKQGFFVALRNVVTVEQDNELVKFISNSYQKIKAVWKKRPFHYFVHKKDDGEFYFNKERFTSDNDLGNLEDLYLDLPNMKENRFTDNYSKTFDIRIGQVVSMPLEECSWSTKDCAEAGLHFTSDEIHYVGCGDTSVLMLINPMKVVGIGEKKGRCYEYLPIMTVDREEATYILHDLDFDTLELDEQYVVKQLEGLNSKVKDGFAEESKKYEFNIPQISSSEINKIVSSLEEMKTIISNRIVNFD